jgi:hypothetical protein
MVTTMDEMKSLKDQIRSVQAACRTARSQEEGRHWEVLTALITVVNSIADIHQRQEERLAALEAAVRGQHAHDHS